MGEARIYMGRCCITLDLHGGGEDLHGEMLHNPLIYMGGFVISPCKSKNMDICIYIYVNIYIYIYVYMYIYI